MINQHIVEGVKERNHLSIYDRTYMHAGSEFYADAMRAESGVEQVGLDYRTSGLPVKVRITFKPP
jgi:hypothetical protein